MTKPKSHGNPNKNKGTAAETRVVNFLLAAGLDASRVVMKGAHDQGDIHIRGGHGCVSAVLEVKAGQQTSNVSRLQRALWLAETVSEAAHAGCGRGFLVIAKHRSGVPDYQVWSSDGRRFWYLDEFVDHAKGGY